MGSLKKFNDACLKLDFLHNMFEFDTLVETGCFKGESIDHVLNYEFMKEVYSCDIESVFVTNCKNKFEKYPFVKILNLDSHSFLEYILPTLKNKSSILFWLDAHYYKDQIPEYNDIDYPLKKEIEIINKHRKNKEDVILIDDVYSLIQNSKQYKHLHNIPKIGIKFLEEYQYNIQLFNRDKGYLFLTR